MASQSCSPFFLPHNFPVLTLAAISHKSTGTRLLLVSSHVRSIVEPSFYCHVELTTSVQLAAFARTIAARPPLARRVRNLWIGPAAASSDLVSALTPVTFGEPVYISTLRARVHSDARNVLRACRRLVHVALAGELLGGEQAHAYGKACAPTTVLSINPYSVVGHFAAPIFSKCQELHVLDTNLAFEEADEIRGLTELRRFLWTTPKDFGSITRDANVLFRFLQRSSHPHPQPSSSSSTPPSEEDAQIAAAQAQASQAELEAAALAEGRPAPPPFRLHRLQSLNVRTSPSRASALYSSLTTSSHSRSFTKAHISCDPLYPGLLESWDALRDLVYESAGQYSRAAFGAGFGDEEDGQSADPGRALIIALEGWRRELDDWEQRSAAWKAEGT